MTVAQWNVPSYHLCWAHGCSNTIRPMSSLRPLPPNLVALSLSGLRNAYVAM